MKIVIDTNVLISAAVAGRDPAAIILIIVANPDYFEKILVNTTIVSVSMFKKLVCDILGINGEGESE